MHNVSPQSLLLLLIALLLIASPVALCLKYLRGPARLTSASIGLAVGVAVTCFWHVHLGPGRYAEFEDIKARLRQMPGVELLDAWGHEDVTWEIGGFTIDVEGRGEIEFGALDHDSFEYTDHLFIKAIGAYELIVVYEGYIGVRNAKTNEPVISTGWGYGIDVGPEGAFSKFFPASLSSVQDVLDRYEEICSELAGWPIQPAYGTFQDEKGTDHYYSVRDPSLDDKWIHPPGLLHEVR